MSFAALLASAVLLVLPFHDTLVHEIQLLSPCALIGLVKSIILQCMYVSGIHNGKTLQWGNENTVEGQLGDYFFDYAAHQMEKSAYATTASHRRGILLQLKCS